MKIYLSLFLFFLGNLCSAQASFHVFKKDLGEKIRNYDLKTALDLINSNKARFNDTQKVDLEVMKVQIFTEFGWYDQSFKLSQNLNVNPNLTSEQKARLYIERALIYEINDNATATKFELDKAEKLFKKYPQLKSKNYTLFLIRKSSYYRVNGFSEMAFAIAKDAEQFAKSINDYYNYADIQFILGLGYKNKSPAKSLEHLKRALFLYKKFKNYESVNAMYTNLGRLFFTKKNYKTANVYADSALVISSKSKVLNYKADIFLLKSNILEMEKKPDSALYYYKTYSSVLNKFVNEQRDLKVKELNVQYNFEKAETEKEQLKEDVTKTRIINFSLLGVLLIFIVFLISLFRNKNKIEAQRQKISEKNKELQVYLEEKQFLVQELNHRIKNNLAVILSLIGFQKDQIESKDYKSRFEDLYQRIKTITVAHELYAYNVNNDDHSYIEIDDYITKIFEIHKNSDPRPFVYIKNIEKISLSIDQSLPLGLIINELITNSLKHAKPDKEPLILNLEISKVEKNIELCYFDNGCFFNFEQNEKSLGLLIIQGMTKQLRGYCSRENAHYKVVF